MSWSYLGPLILVGWALVVIALEHLWPYDRGEKLIRKGFTLDFLWYGILQSVALFYVITPFVNWIDGMTHLSSRGLVSSWPFWVQLTFFIVSHDFYIYWFHRFQHKNRYLWRLHEAHHSAEKIDWIAGARSHPLEIFINQSIEIGAMVLLGASPTMVAVKMLISSAWGMWIHCNVGVNTGWLQYVINGPEMHRWHHSLTFREGGQNYATKFGFWDWMFNSWYRPARKPDGYGISNPFPQGYFGQVVAAFRKFDGPWPVPPTLIE